MSAVEWESSFAAVIAVDPPPPPDCQTPQQTITDVNNFHHWERTRPSVSRRGSKTRARDCSGGRFEAGWTRARRVVERHACLSSALATAQYTGALSYDFDIHRPTTWRRCFTGTNESGSGYGNAVSRHTAFGSAATAAETGFV